MSMTGEYCRVTGAQLEKLLVEVKQNAEAFADHLYSETDELDKPEPKLSIGKLWQGIHFILNGDPDDVTSIAGSIVGGGEEVGADMNYGPVRFMTPSQVQDVTQALQPFTEEEFKSRFDPVAFRAADIYSGGDWSHPGDFALLWKAFTELRGFFHAGAEAGDAMLLYIA